MNKNRGVLATGILSLATILIAWLVILLSIHYNPWFDIYKNALSDMGRLDNPNNKIFNYGLILTGLLGLSLPVFASLSSRTRWGQASAGVFFVAITHLILIGVYPEGTDPHFYVSVEFFLFKWVGVLFYSIGLISERRYGTGVTGILLFGIMVLSALMIDWPSVGMAEVTSIGLFTIWLVLAVGSVFARARKTVF